MSSESDRRVLIAGGGIAGLAVRRALHRKGIPSLTLERRDAPADAGLAINLPGNAVRALSQLGVLEALRGVGARVRRREYRSSGDRLLFAVDEEAFWGAEMAPHCVRRADLLQLLHRDLPAGDVRHGEAITAVRSHGTCPEVDLSDGSLARGGLLVGADGIHSVVRRSVFGAATLGAALLAHRSWRFMAPNPGVEAWTLWAGKGTLFLLIPLDRGEVYGWISVGSESGTGGDLMALRTAFAAFPRAVRATLEAVLDRPDTLYHSPLEEVRIPAWAKGRTVLAGDAAHASAPVWAQGAALALEDALVLASLAADSADWGEVGPQFENLRRPRVAHVQAMTDRMSRSAGLPSWARSVLLPVLGPRSYRTTYGPLRIPVAG